jgi:hypothetical protein
MAKATMTTEDIKIDISKWTMGEETAEKFKAALQTMVTRADMTVLEAVVMEAATDALNIAAGEYPADVMFPVAWDSPEFPGDNQKDPMMIRITLPLSDESKDMPAWYVSLADMVEESLHLHGYDDGVEYYSEGLARLRDAFLALAARIDEVIKAGDGNPTKPG